MTLYVKNEDGSSVPVIDGFNMFGGFAPGGGGGGGRRLLRN
jgi:hypothetical protein